MISPARVIELEDYSVLRGKTWRVSEKIKGSRRLFHKSSTGIVTAYTFSGRKDVWIKHIAEFLEDESFPCNYIYDMALVDRVSLFNDVEPYQLNSITNTIADLKFSNFKQDLMGICFDTFSPGKYMIGYERTELLRKLFEHLPLSSPVAMVPIFGNVQGEDIEQINIYLVKALSSNGKGIVLMDLDSIYIPGKSNSLIKIDNELTDLESIYLPGRSNSLMKS